MQCGVRLSGTGKDKDSVTYLLNCISSALQPQIRHLCSSQMSYHYVIMYAFLYPGLITCLMV